MSVRVRNILPLILIVLGAVIWLYTLTLYAFAKNPIPTEILIVATNVGTSLITAGLTLLGVRRVVARESAVSRIRKELHQCTRQFWLGK